MSGTCLVCKAIHLEMIEILRHPGKLDYMLNCLLGLQAQQDDYLCNKCCNDVINAFDAKQKFHQFSLFEPKVLGKDGVIVKDEVDQSEKTVSAMSAVKIEPISEGLEEDVEYADDRTTDINQCEVLEAKVKEQRDAVEKYRPASQESVHDGKRENNSSILDQTMSSKNFNITTVDSGCKQTNSRQHFKREKSTDIEMDSIDEEKPNDDNEVGEISCRFISNTNDRLEHDITYVCCQCEKNFTTLVKLKLHERSHTGEKQYKCFDCGKAFITAFQLNNHKRVHTRETPYKCHDCKKVFITTFQLKQHERAHTGHKCSECGKAYKRSYELKLHVRTHTGEKPYKCCECEESFISFRKLKDHKITHREEKPHKCCECGKAFITASQLNKHKRVHHRERPYKCHECKKGFIRSYDLKLHVRRVHTGENRYKCCECQQIFTTVRQLEIHKKSHRHYTVPLRKILPKEH